MNWLNSFSKTYLINLPERKDRLQKSTDELNKYNIPFEVFEATKHEDGRIGIFLTLKKMFEQAIGKNYKKPILSLEDDVRFLANPNLIMNDVMSQLPADFHMLFLGCNHNAPLTQKYSDCLIKVTKAKALHAVVYSMEAIELLLPHMEKFEKSIDRTTRDVLQPLGKSYCTYPMIATQYNGYSDIEGEDVDYTKCLEKRFEQNIKGIK